MVQSGVARSEGLEYHSAYAGSGELVAQCLLCDAREEVDEHHAAVHGVVGVERPAFGSAVEGVEVEVDAESYLCRGG